MTEDGWSRRLVVRTPGFHPGNRGFESRRDHHFLMVIFELISSLCLCFGDLEKVE